MRMDDPDILPFFQKAATRSLPFPILRALLARLAVKYRAIMPGAAASFPKARSLKKLEADARFVLDDQGSADATVSVSFATMAQMRRMKKTYLGKDQEVVDVLAFPESAGFPHPDDPSRIGEIFLNWDAFKHDFDHLRFLLVHGVLHLLGYTHEEKSDIIVMERLERNLCRRIASQESISARTR